MLSGILSGKHGNKESIVTWTRNCIIANFVMIGFFILIDPSSITSMGITMHQPCAPGVFWMTMFLEYGIAILGWICTLNVPGTRATLIV